MSDDMNLGATGEFPDGKIKPDDDGEIRFAIGSDPDKGIIVLDFGKPTAWIGLSPEDADNLATMLKKHAKRARGET